MNRIRKTALGALAVLASLTDTPAGADDKVRRREAPPAVELDQEEALSRRHRSEFKPLSEVLAAGQNAIPGEVLRVRLKRVRGQVAYELKIITSQGQLREVYIDPMTLDTLKVE